MSEKEYIERGALLSFMRDNQQLDYEWAYRIVHGFPAADVEPVVRGEWKAGYVSGLKVSDGAVCSECDCWSGRRSTFCPNCGSHMQEKPNE